MSGVASALSFYVFLLLAGSGTAVGQQALRKLAIVVRESPVYSSPDLAQSSSSRATLDTIFIVQEEKIDGKGRIWLRVSDEEGKSAGWVLKSACVIRQLGEVAQVRSIVSQVRSKPWSSFDKERVIKGVVDISMNEEQVKLSWGEPIRVQAQPQGEEWNYGPYSLIFRTGVVAEILTKPITR
jgi:hypothetical protein